MKERIANAMLLAAVTMLAALPMFRYQFLHLGGHIFPRPPTGLQAYHLAVGQGFVTLVAAFLSALVAFLYRERLGLPPFGRWADLRGWLLAGLLAGLAIAPLAYLGGDRILMARVPALFPPGAAAALAQMAGAALAQEVIFRLGLLTIGIYFLRRWGWAGYPWPAVAGVCMFAAAGNYLLLAKFQLIGEVGVWRAAATLAPSFALQCLFSAVYLRAGFLAAAGFHAGVQIRLLLYALLR